jgi:hypothetical protein
MGLRRGLASEVCTVRWDGVANRACVPNAKRPDEGLQGTIRLDILVGHVFVIDFPKRVCLMNRADVPESLMEAPTWVPARISDGKFRENFFGTQGALGNGLFFNSIVILDVGSHPEFGIISLNNSGSM